MTQANTLTIEDLIRELSAGRATVKFILKRFDQWLPFDRIDGDHRYSPQTLTQLMQIRDWLDSGMLPSQIETLLSEAPTAPQSGENTQPPEKDIRMSKDALGFIQELFTDIKHHQSRIAKAHEKRAEAEERKAVAIEKRAEAEEKKAAAMNNIASALQEMNRQRAADLSAREMDAEEIAAQTARAITMNDTDLFSDADPFDDDLPPFDDDGSDLDIEDLEAAFDAQDPDPPNQESQARENQQQGPIELEDIVEDDFSSNDTLNEDPSDTDDFDIDDISLPLDLLDPESPDDIHAETDATAGEPEIIDLDSPADPLDDLSALIDTVSETIPDTDDTQADNLEGLLGDDPELPELDDLFAEGEENAENLSPDDLYSLVDETDRATQALPDTDIDDLSSLVDEPEMSPEQDLDDLSLLVDTKTPSLEPETLDDLSLLVDPPESPLESPLGAGDLDDLSLLVDTAPTADATDLDDLSLLVDMPEPQATSGDMDDLSLLVQDEPFGTSTGADDRETTTDNLWDLVKDEKKGHDQNMPMDDLSALVDAPEDDEQKKPERPSLKPDITPEENLNAYKAAVMKIIIDLKSQGLTPEETTDRLNGDGVATLSGKPKWAQKAIAKIYGYIDSAK